MTIDGGSMAREQETVIWDWRISESEPPRVNIGGFSPPDIIE
jgi:hypothetical protein